MAYEELLFDLYRAGAIRSNPQGGPLFNTTQAWAFPHLIRKVSQALWEAASDIPCDLLFGASSSSLPWTTCIALEHNLPMLTLENNSWHTGKTCLIVADLVTSEDLNIIADLRKNDIVVSDILAIFENKTLLDPLSQYNISQTALFTTQSISDFIHEKTLR